MFGKFPSNEYYSFQNILAPSLAGRVSGRGRHKSHNCICVWCIISCRFLSPPKMKENYWLVWSFIILHLLHRNYDNTSIRPLRYAIGIIIYHHSMLWCFDLCFIFFPQFGSILCSTCISVDGVQLWHNYWLIINLLGIFRVAILCCLLHFVELMLNTSLLVC